MSEFHVIVVKIGELNKHPNADTLSTTKVFDYNVIVKSDLFKEGDLAIYVPIDSIVPDNEYWSFLVNSAYHQFDVGSVPLNYRRIKAKKIRGIFSQGFLMPIQEAIVVYGNCFNLGQECAEILGITKYEPTPELTSAGDCESKPVGWVFNQYTDIEGMRRYPNILMNDEEVVLTEKIHGCNARFVHDGTRLWVGSHHQIKAPSSSNYFWQIAYDLKLEQMLSSVPGMIFFGEVFGATQDLNYNVKTKSRLDFLVFDVYDVKNQKYLDFNDGKSLAEHIGLQWVPILYKGKWNDSLRDFCEGKSTLATHVREGFVVRPIHERWNKEIGRVILKQCGQGYMLRKVP